MSPRIVSSVVVLALGVGGCTLDISGTGGGLKPGDPGYTGPGLGPGMTGGAGSVGAGGGGPVVGIPGIDPGTPADPLAAGPMPLRRLTHREYNNTVRDLLGVTSNPADAFPLDVDGTFTFHRSGVVSTLDASTLRDAAEALVKPLDIAKLLPCQPSGGEDACAAQFITTFGAKAYRRPVAADESARLTALFKTARTTMMLDFNESIRVLVEAIVQSPGFLYRWELGNNTASLEGAVAKLTPYEVASRLSYFFWRSMPDKALFADNIAKTTKLTAPSLQLGVRSAGDGEPTSWKGPGQKNVPETDPKRLFTRLFAGMSTPAPQVDALLLRRKSILDFLGKDLEAYGTKLGTEDKAKIQAHLQAIRDLEKQLEGGAGPGLACTAPSEPAATKDTPTLMKLMFEMAGIAINCDHTRVISIDLYDDGGGDGNNFPWLGISDDYHTVAHADGNMAEQKTKIDAWIFSQVALMLAKLEGSKEGDGTALDNTVVVTANDMEDGASHYVGKVPFVLIGSCGGYLKTGQFQKYSKVGHNRLLVTLLNAMDVPVESFGAAGYGGALSELTNA